MEISSKGTTDPGLFHTNTGPNKEECKEEKTPTRLGRQYSALRQGFEQFLKAVSPQSDACLFGRHIEIPVDFGAIAVTLLEPLVRLLEVSTVYLCNLSA